MHKKNTHKSNIIRRQNELNLYDYGYYYSERFIENIDKLKEENKNLPEPIRLRKWFDDYAKELEKVSSLRIRKMRFRKYASRVAIIFLTLMISTAVVTMSVEAFRIQFLNWFIESEQDHNRVDFENLEPTLNLPEDWTNYYSPTYIPEGYTLLEAYSNDSMKTILLTNQQGKLLLIIQSNGDMGLNIDNEDTVLKTIAVNNSEAIITEKDGLITITWTNEGVIFSVEGEENTNIMIRVSEKLKKNSK